MVTLACLKLRGRENGMGGGAGWGLGRRDTAAFPGLLSAASRSSAPGGGRGNNSGHEGAAARRGCSLRSACRSGRSRGERKGEAVSLQSELFSLVPTERR